MPTALRVLLREVLDYAGLFPPAKLELSEALRAYETHREGREKEFLGRFVIPARLLKDLPADLPEMALSVIGHDGDWPEAREADAEAMNAHLERLGDFAPIEAYEVKMPSATELHWIADLERFGADETYVEIPLDSQEGLTEALAALAETETLFAKARLSPAPSPGEVAIFLQGCLHLDLPFKLTAGLHQPFPHDKEFGFLNILGACPLVLNQDLSRRELEEALTDKEGWSFDDGVSWRGHKAGPDAVEEARELFRSFGSCSVEEPAHELRTSGLWPF